MKKPKPQESSRQPRKRTYSKETGLTVFEPNVVYFDEYLEMYIGAKWPAIKRSLYDAGYQTPEVSEYRSKLIKEYYRLCNTNKLYGVI